MNIELLESIEIVENLLLSYQEKIKKLPDNEKLQKGFNDLIQVRGTLWNLGKEVSNERS
jgi:hypothetical protein